MHPTTTPTMNGGATVTKNTVQITVISDFTCPWCFVAHRALQTALATLRSQHPATAFHVDYRPYELNPQLADDKSQCRIQTYMKKFGGEERFKDVCGVLQERGKEVGINFIMRGRIRQTTNAHRLVLKAFCLGGEAGQTKMIDQLFSAYYEDPNGDIGCSDFLSCAAEKTGLMSFEKAKTFLESDYLKKEVALLLQDAQLKGIKGVPCTVINNKFLIQGAERVETFYKALDLVAKSGENGTSTVNPVAAAVGEGAAPAPSCSASSPTHCIPAPITA